MSDSSSDSSSDGSSRKGEEELKQAQPKAEGAAKAGQQPKKGKKKNAPDRPQPAWLFPPDDENPVLNPKVLTEAEKKKLYEERMEAIRFLKYKSVSAPMKTAPPGQLLTLIGAFLGSYGFNSTGRIFTLERNARKKLDGWQDEIGAPLEKGMPGLVKIFKDWSKEWHERRELDMSSSDEDDDAVTKRAKMVKRRDKVKIAKTDDTSSSGSDESSNDNSGVAVKGKTSTSTNAGNSTKAEASPSGSSSSSTSDSDADDETDKKAKALASKSTVSSLVNNLKRKASPIEPTATASSSDSDSDSELNTSDSEAPANKKKKTKADVKLTAKVAAAAPASNRSKKGSKKEAPAKAAARASSSSGSSSSDSSSSGSDSDAVDNKKPTTVASEASKPSKSVAPPTINGRKTSEPSDSSATLVEATKKELSPSSSSSGTSDSEASTKAAKVTITTSTATKRKRSTSPKPATPATNGKKPKKTNTPFSRIPEDTKVDPKLASNAYVPYEYAEKAHQDLIVTKGKGFTKEKNKKKRGA